jgi:hypothetical protein
MSSDVFPSSSSFTDLTRGFEGVTTSSAMIKSSPPSTKIEGVVETIWYLHSEGVNAFIQKIKVGVRRGSDDRTS